MNNKNWTKAKLTIQQILDCLFSTEAAAIAFNTLTAIIPCYACILWGINFIAVHLGLNQIEGKFENLSKQFLSYLGVKNDSIFEYASNYINSLGDGTPFLLVGLLVFVSSLTGVYYEIEKYFNQIWEIQDERSFWKKRIQIKKVAFVLLILIFITIIVTFLNIFIPVTFLTTTVEFFLVFWLSLYLAFRFIPKRKANNRNTIMISLLVAIFVTMVLIIGTRNSVISNFSSPHIYGTKLFIYLLLYYIIWVAILFGYRLIFELEMGISNFLGEKRLKWKEMSYKRKEALCWHFYSKFNKEITFDPKIKIWAMEKLTNLGLLQRENNNYKMVEPQKGIEDFHKAFYNEGNFLPNEVEDSSPYQESMDAIENVLDRDLKSRSDEKEKEHNEKIKKATEEKCNEKHKQELDAANDTIADAKKRIKELEKEIENTKHQKEKLQASLNEEQRNIKNLKQELSETNSQLENQKRETEQAHKKINDLKEEMNKSIFQKLKDRFNRK